MRAAAPGLFRRFASGLYDLLLVTALVLIATFPFLAFMGDATSGWRRHILQFWVLGVTGAYFVWFWTTGGQTLAMKTWHIRIVGSDGEVLGVGRAIHRYLLAVLGFFALGLGFLWALVDRDRQFLHDRLAGTAIIDAKPKVAAAKAG